MVCMQANLKITNILLSWGKGEREEAQLMLHSMSYENTVTALQFLVLFLHYSDSFFFPQITRNWNYTTPSLGATIFH